MKKLKSKFVEWLLIDHPATADIKITNNTNSGNMEYNSISYTVYGDLYIDSIKLDLDLEIVIRKKITP